eukprot:9191788-Alexandrium_andersonii.AAC.1
MLGRTRATRLPGGMCSSAAPGPAYRAPSCLEHANDALLWGTMNAVFIRRRARSVAARARPCQR